jgi:hypothetical protein
MQLAHVWDGDSGAGTQWTQGVLLKTPASGGAVDIGVSGQPLRIDPTGTTTQPISGTVGISGTVAPCRRCAPWHRRSPQAGARGASNSANTPSIAMKHLPAAVLVSIGCSVVFSDAPRAFDAKSYLEKHNAALAEYARWAALLIALGAEIPSQG